MHESHTVKSLHRRDAQEVSSTWSACVEGFMFIVLNEGHRGALDLVPLRDGDGTPLPCSPQECATGGRTPSYRVRGGRLVKV